MVGFIKACDQYLINFGIFFESMIPSPTSPFFFVQEKIFSENAVLEEWVISFCLVDNDKNAGESFACGHEYK